MKEILISVVMSTYNGEQYITEQLNSIFLQTRPVDEVIIQDDCSSDRTVELIRAFIVQNELKNWHLFCNTVNLGWKRSFVEGVVKAKGKWIFFCDQDDIWVNKKVEVMTNIMENNSSIWLLTSDYKILNMDNQKSYVKKKRQAKVVLEKYQPKNNIISVHYPGCTYCISSAMLPYYKAYWSDVIPHDAFAWSIANIYGHLYFLHRELIVYRRHGNTVTGRQIESKEQRIRHIQSFEVLLNIYKKLVSGMKEPVLDTKEIENISCWNANRYKIIHEKNLTAAFRNLSYLKYYNSWLQFLMDIKRALEGNREHAKN